MLIENSKLYVQLQPNANAVNLLQTLQENLSVDRNMHLVSAESLHLTVIHIGKLSRIIQSIQRSIDTSEEVILNNADALSQQLQFISSAEKYQNIALEVTGSDRFGSNGTTLVVTYQINQLLSEIHKECLASLMQFLRECGVANPIGFMRNDYNLVNALSIEPHVTIVKGYHGDMITVSEQTMSFSMMPIIY